MFLKWLVVLLVGIAICFGMNNYSLASSNSICNKKVEKEHQVMEPLSVKTPKMVNVHLKTTFIDGISIVNIVPDHFISAETVMAKYSGWRMAKCNERDVFLFKKVDDLSPISKTAGIFGLKDGNILTLYKGNPNEKQIIQTFFQIDVNAMEADAANQLQHGIKISNKKQYNKVIHDLSKFAVKLTPGIESKS